MRNLVDLARLELFVQRLDFHLADLPRARRREVRRELRSNARAAAAEIGMARALANLGHPRVLAAGYVTAEGRPLPRYRRGALVAGVIAVAYVWALALCAVGLADGSHGAAPSGARVSQSFLGTAVTTTTGPGVLSFHLQFNALILLVPLVVFALVARVWRALPSQRRPA
jgi:hypothetical protein